MHLVSVGTMFNLCLKVYMLLLRNYLVDTGRKFNVHKTFRRRPGHLLNVLCAFNLRPVSMEILA